MISLPNLDDNACPAVISGSKTNLISHGAKTMLKLIKWLFVGSFVLLAGFILLAAIVSAKRPAKQNAAVGALSYLNEIPEVAWHKVDGNSAYIGFAKPLPEDWELIIKGAAVKANKATNFGFHTWAVPAENQTFRPGVDPSYGEATARNGKIVK